MIESKETFDTRVLRVGNYLVRAYKHNKTSILFAMYLSEFLRIDVEKSLEKFLIEHGLKIVYVDAEKNKDIPSYVSSINSINIVFLVHNIEKGFPEVIQFLNFKREEFVEHQIKIVFWVNEQELVRISTEAPDFFAFRNRVVEFMETPIIEEFRWSSLVEFAKETDYKSIDEIRHSIDLKEKLLFELSSEDEIRGYLLNSLGVLYDKISDYKKAIDYFEKALQITKKFSDRQDEGSILGNIGVAYINLGNNNIAIEYLTKSLEINLFVFGDKHPNVAISYNNLGSAWLDLGNANKAIEFQTKSLEINLLVFGDKHPDVARDYNNLGEAWRSLGNANKAIEYLTKALEINLLVLGDKHPNVAASYNNLGLAWNDLGNTNKAIEYYTKALEIDLLVFGDKHPKIAIRYNNLGAAWRDLDNTNKAIEYLTKALEIYTSTYGADHPKTKTIKSNLDLLTKK
ncbi:tetratricopeptide repeat protein [Candidatus Desantisbacteria bacterium]|nr:tetratricopeptide repeat protein [Candidatus Desantisbacteria bacterium]